MSIDKYNWLAGYDGSGLKIHKLFTASFETLPNRAVYKINTNVNDIEVSKLQELFPNTIIRFEKFLFQNTNSCVEDQEADYETVDSQFSYEDIVKLNRLESEYYIYDNKLIITISSSKIQFLYLDQNIDKILKDLLKIIPQKEEKQDAKINLVVYDNGFYTIDSKIKRTHINLKENYNDDFLPVYKDLVSFIQDRNSGIAIIRGNPGVGKSFVLRHLITNCPANYILITNIVASQFADPAFISFLLDNRNSIFILEDCEQLLLSREESFNSAISSILNMSDGLMSDIFNIKFICTFNADIKKIDDAILRKGRCFINYEFQPLCIEKSQKLLNKFGIKAKVTKPMTFIIIMITTVWRNLLAKKSDSNEIFNSTRCSR